MPWSITTPPADVTCRVFNECSLLIARNNMTQRNDAEDSHGAFVRWCRRKVRPLTFSRENVCLSTNIYIAIQEPGSRGRKRMKTEQFDVVIIGAGLSGIGAARYLKTRLPNKSFVILETKPRMGGTWDLFRYPGIRSDSDMHTMGYAFKPWKHPKAISEGGAIIDYIEETAAENGIKAHIRFQHKVITAAWSSKDSLWTLDVE